METLTNDLDSSSASLSFHGIVTTCIYVLRGSFHLLLLVTSMEASTYFPLHSWKLPPTSVKNTTINVVCIGLFCCSLLCWCVRVSFSFTLNARPAAQPHQIQPRPSPTLSPAHGHTSGRAPRPFCLVFYPDVVTEPRSNKRLFPRRPQAKGVILSPTIDRTASCGMKVLRGLRGLAPFDLARSAPSPQRAVSSTAQDDTFPFLCNRPPADPPDSLR